MDRANQTIVFQSPNRVGLGHLNRLASIAAAVRGLNSAVRTPFLVDGTSHALLEAYGLPYISLPGLRNIEASDSWSLWPREEKQQLALAMSTTLLRRLAADLVVFDCFPEESVLLAAAHLHLPMILVLRAMRDYPRYLQRLEPMIRVIQSIVVVHNKGDIALPSALDGKVVYVGEVVRPELGNKRQRRDSIGTRQVVITGGGGGSQSAANFYNLAIRAMAIVHEQMGSISTLVITGPLFSDWLSLELRSGIAITPFDPHICQKFSDADLVIVQGGYNTINEVAVCARSAICVPVDTGYDDQFRRVALASETHKRLVAFEGRTPCDLAAVIVQCLKVCLPLQDNPIPHGAVEAANYLLSLCDGEVEMAARFEARSTAR